MSTASNQSRSGAHAATDVASEAQDEDTRAIQIAAAQLRLVTDRRLGKQTPEWVKQLAAEKPDSPAS
ncbi:hypothetical protein [Arthrobacter sp. SLBN-122]|uniref:hypothetical protein n=1 Tax=Arthrobacter sp. SLBN-122 TaxID=2768455 RepID=UPI001153355F|nr:hypothetical protein [Arthrobacter sp. SLBN-122]